MALGILGGMSWTSTASYYRLINHGFHAAKGKQHSADLLLSSVDFQTIIDLQVQNKWLEAGEILADRAKNLVGSGAEALLIASNTMHKVLNVVEKDCAVPILNIFDAVSDAIRAANITTVGLLGTRYTMNDPYFVQEYKKRGITVISPDSADAKLINEIIFRELIHGTITDKSRGDLVNIAERLQKRGCGGVVLGCTELALLEPKSDVMFFDSTELHCNMAIRWLTSQP